MRYITFLCFALLLSVHSLQAKKILADLDFRSGEWAMIGVPLHNYQLLPIQQELKTFISKDVSFMMEIQQQWDLEMTFEDKCDFHYELKFYQGNELKKNLKLNLYCGYINVDGLSYKFIPHEFDKFRERAFPINWSRISFADLNKLKNAVQTLSRAEDVYWYEEVKQYEYSGFFMLSVGDIPWSSDLDSLYSEVNQRLVQQAGNRRFFLQKYFHIIQGDFLYVRYLVNCEPELSDRLSNLQYLGWRSHLHNRDSVRILAIGVDQKRYWELMRNR